MREIWQMYFEPYLSADAILALSLASALMVVASLVVTPWVIRGLPSDYFICQRLPLIERLRRGSPREVAMLVMKNLAGLLLILAGVAMLFLPGQGILTLVGGVVLMDFPGKFKLERRLISLPRVFVAINWVRRKTGSPPLVMQRPHQ